MAFSPYPPMAVNCKCGREIGPSETMKNICEIDCPECNGKGSKGFFKKCVSCTGSGKIPALVFDCPNCGLKMRILIKRQE